MTHQSSATVTIFSPFTAVPKDFEGAELQPDFVKLDRELVQGAYGDRVQSVLLCAIADAAHQLGIGVVAEGVETADDANFCRDIGADLAQGYFFARPASPPPSLSDEAQRWLANL
jgi:EAL domain-containing protein (putative c-di-GMP-specific phosphodiesterase class I)